MSDSKRVFKGYIYTCESHNLGKLVRRVEDEEMKGIESLGRTLRHDHATNCWIRGCQHKLTQVRLVEIAST